MQEITRKVLFEKSIEKILRNAVDRILENHLYEGKFPEESYEELIERLLKKFNKDESQ